MRQVLTAILLLAGVVFALDALVVLLGRGVRIDVGWVTLRSTTIEFPVIATLSCVLLLLLVKGKWKETLTLLAALVFSAGGGEAVLRVIDHPWSKPWMDYAQWYEPSDVFGHQLIRNFEGFGPLEVPVKINSHGFRDIEHGLEKPPNTIRILGLGDSFTFGWGVEQSKTFLKQLEPLLQARTGKTIETMNAGVPGWGLNQYFILLKGFGLSYAPDFVVLAYYADDLTGELAEAIPANESYRNVSRYQGGVLHHSRLFNFMKAVSNWVRQKNRPTRVDYLYNEDARRALLVDRPNYLMTQDERSPHYEALLGEHLKRLRTLAEEHGAILVVMYVPDIAQLYHPEVQYINQSLARLTNLQGIPFVDMTSMFEQAKHPKAYYLWPRDPHTNAEGHRAMAEALAKLICDSSNVDSVFCEKS